MEIQISYGKGKIEFSADPSLANWQVIKPKYQEAVLNPEEVFQTACNSPIGCQPLKEIIKPDDRVVIVTSDGTRSVPNQILIPMIIKMLPVPAENITILLGNGAHRRNTPKEIEEMFGVELANTLRIVNHDAFDTRQNQLVGKTASKGSVYVNKLYLQASKRIVLGFIEPHFFAGFSGGAKGVIPGIAGVETILHLHRAELIAHPKSTWGEMVNNPIQNEIAETIKMCPPDFLVNVTLNSEKQITGFYVGNYSDAHTQGCAKVKESSMIPVSHKFPIVITSNSGYPLDQNLYQTVKGISAAARIVEQGGIIFVASECADGIPSNGNFAQIMMQGSSPDDIFHWILNQRKPVLDQWQGQILASILKKTEVAICSSIPSDTIKTLKLTPIDNLQTAVTDRIRSLGNRVDVVIIPDGPLIIASVEP